MILTAIFLNEYGDWNLIDLFKMDMPDSFKEWQLSEAVKQATKFLENLQNFFSLSVFSCIHHKAEHHLLY